MELNLENYGLERVDKTRIMRDRTSIAMILKCILLEIQTAKVSNELNPIAEALTGEEVEVKDVAKEEIDLSMPYKELLSTAKKIADTLEVKLPQARSTEALKTFIKDNT